MNFLVDLILYLLYEIDLFVFITSWNVYYLFLNQHIMFSIYGMFYKWLKKLLSFPLNKMVPLTEEHGVVHGDPVNSRTIHV